MRIVITGATGGIGRATALRLAAEPGARFCLVVREPSRAEPLAAELRALGSKAHLVVADITNAGMGEVVARAAIDAMGGIDALVVSSGSIANEGALQTLPLERFQASFDINTRPSSCLRRPLILNSALVAALSSRSRRQGASTGFRPRELFGEQSRLAHARAADGS